MVWMCFQTHYIANNWSSTMLSLTVVVSPLSELVRVFGESQSAVSYLVVLEAVGTYVSC